MSLERGIVFEVQKDYESEMLDSLKETGFPGIARQINAHVNCRDRDSMHRT